MYICDAGDVYGAPEAEVLFTRDDYARLMPARPS